MTRTPRRELSKAMREFLSEAQELVEGLGRTLLDLDEALKVGEPDPEVINEAFRGWHTVKGLASTFGAESIARLAHEEEGLLDDIRMGRTVLSPEVLDALLDRVESAVRALAAIDASGDLDAADETLGIPPKPKRTSKSGRTSSPGSGKGGEGGLDLEEVVPSEVLEVLTEFEEHRLRLNLVQGNGIYRIRVRFALQSMDTDLDDIKRRLKPLGEVITYLPSMQGGDGEQLDIDVVFALHASHDDLDRAVEPLGAVRDQLVAPRKMSRDTSRFAPLESRASPPLGPTLAGAVPSYPAMVSMRPSLAPPGRPKEALVAIKHSSRSVRVDIGKLDRLMNTVGELEIIRTAITKVSESLRATVGRRDLAIELHRVTRSFERRLAEMREGILEVRMVPVGQMFDRLTRMARKISRGLGKEIHLVVAGADTEVDKLIVEELSDPLMHIIRNAIDHGIESLAVRRRNEKPDMGTVALTAYNKGNHVIIEVEDDGAGIDGAKIADAAVRGGFLSREAVDALSEREMLELVFLPGVTTTEEATELSGRGVGMDVVKTNISALGGVVELQTEVGTGTKLTITMPATLAIIPALLVVVGDDTYAVPLNTVAEALMLSPSEVRTFVGTDTMELRGKTLPLCRLDRFFGLDRVGPIPEGARVVVTSLGQRRVGLVVDGLVGQKDVVIKPLGESLAADSRCFAGATDLGDQRLSLVLDTAAVIDEFFASTDDGARALSIGG